MAGNQEQIDYWNGNAGQRWASHQQALDRAIEPFGQAVLDRVAVGPGQAVLDVGCGCGATTIAVAERVAHNGRVVGVDVSRPMLEVARARCELQRQVELLCADASSHPFEAAFDAVVSRFGVMFFADPPAAFGNLRCALRPGGRLGFASWREPRHNPWCIEPMMLALQVLGDDQPPFAPGGPGPFALADRDGIADLLAGAGFAEVAIEPVDYPVVVSDSGVEGALDFALRIGPVARLLAERSDDERARVEQRLAAYWRASVADESDCVSAPGSAWIVTARAPA